MKSTLTAIAKPKVGVTGKGLVKFNNGQFWENIILAPDDPNLISISAATKNGASFVFVCQNINVGKTIVDNRGRIPFSECLVMFGRIVLFSFNIHDGLLIQVNMLGLLQLFSTGS